MSDIVVDAQLWGADQEGSISTWYYADGDAVQAGQIVAELMHEKVQYEVVADMDGVLRILVQVGDSIVPGQAIGRIEPA